MNGVMTTWELRSWDTLVLFNRKLWETFNLSARKSNIWEPLVCVKVICDLTVHLPYLSKQEYWSWIACVPLWILLFHVAFTAQMYSGRSMALSGVPVPLVIRDVPRCLHKPTLFLTQIWSWLHKTEYNPWLWKNNFSKSFNTIGTWFTRRARWKVFFFLFVRKYLAGFSVLETLTR